MTIISTGAAMRPLRAVRAVMLVGTALGGTLAGSAALAQNIVYAGPGPYTLTRTDTISGGPRTIDVTVPTGDISISTATVNVDNQNPDTYTQNNPTTATGVGISANNTGTGNVTIASGTVSATGPGQTTDIDARTVNGSILINSGTATSTTVGSAAIIGQSTGTTANGGVGNITIVADQTIGGKRGIYTSGNGVTTITSNFATANGNTYQPNAIIGQGASVVVNSQLATLTGANGNQGTAIFVQSFVGDATITSVTASTQGYGQLGLDVQYANANGFINSGTVTTQGDYAAGIYDSAVANNVVKSGSITTSGVGATGIRISPASLVSNSVPTTGSADVTSTTITTTGANADGIVVSPTTTNGTTTNGTSMSGNTLIKSDTIGATGVGSRGIVVAGSTGTVGIVSNAITTGGGNGIDTNAGATTIASTSITGANFRGINATSTGTLGITSGTIALANNAATANAGGILTRSSGNQTITSGSITSGGGNAFGIDAAVTDVSGQPASSLTIASTGTIVATGVAPTNGTAPVGILVAAGAGPVSITANAIDAAGRAIRISSTGAATVSTTSNILSRTSNAISLNTGSFDITTAAGTTVSAGSGATIAGGAATGSGRVTNNGTVAATGAGESGIGITTLGDATVVSKTITVEGAAAPTSTFKSGAISAVSTGGGNVSITSDSATVGGAGRYGIYGSTTGAGTITIASNVASSASNGLATIQALGATGAVNVNSTALTYTGADAAALSVQATTGAVTINSGTVTTSGLGAQGILAQTSNGNIAITSGTVTTTGAYDAANGNSSDAIVALASGSGAISINSTKASAVGQYASAIFASGGGAVNIVSGAASGVGDSGVIVGGISRTGNVTINATTTTAAGVGSAAVYGRAIAGDVSIVSGTASTAGSGASAVIGVGGGAISITSDTASSTGAQLATVYANGTGAGLVTIKSNISTATGNGAYAVEGHAATGNLSIASSSASASQGTGIYGTAGGIATITSTYASAAGDGQAGIYAVGGTGVTLNSGTAVSSGALQINGNTVRRADAIYLEATTGAVNATIGSATATGAGADAVHILANGTGGAATVAITGAVSATNGYGLFIDPPGAVSVNVASGASVAGSLNGINTVGSSSTVVNAGSISSSGGAGIVASGVTTLTNSGSIAGTGGTAVQLGATNDSVTLLTGSSVTGAIAGGGGTDAAFLSGTSNTAAATQTIAAFTGFDSLTVQKGYWTAATTMAGGSTFNSVTVAGGSSLELANTATGITGIVVPTFTDNGTLVVRSSATSAGSTFGAVKVGGSGSVLFTGTGTATLDGTNSITTAGGIVVDSGKLVLTGTQGGPVTTSAGGTFQIGNGGTSGIFTGSLVDNGTLNVNHSDDYTFAGALSGAGSIVKDGAGKLTFGTGYAFTGTTTINAGSIKLTGPVAANTEIDLAGSGQLDLSGTPQTIAELAGTGTAASINIAGGSLTDNQSTNTTFAGTLVGNGSFTKTGTGSVNFTGNNTYTGATTVSGGRLAVNGSIVSPVTVTSGGTLGGTGTTGSVTIGAGGTYAPGNSIGTQTVNGNVVFAAGSIYAVEANSAGQADRVNATGSITINGGTVAVTATPGTYNNLTNYTILTAGAGVTGTFTGVTSNLAFLSPYLTYGTGTVTLSLARNDVSFAAMASTRNQTAVANAAQALGLGNVVYNTILVQTTTSAPIALDQLSGEIYAALPTVLIDGGRRMNDAALSRSHVSGDGVALWVQGIQSYTTGSQTGLTRLTGNKTGTYGGVDYGMGGVRLGVLGGYVDDRVDLAARGSTARIKTTYLGGMASWQGERAAVAIGGSYAWHDLSASRALNVAGLAPTLASKFKAHSVNLYAQASYDLLRGPIALAPFIRDEFTSLRSGPTAETGGLGALTLDRDRRDAHFTSVGVKLAATARASDTVAILPRGSVSYRHGWDDLGGDTRSVSFGGGSALFAVNGTRLGRDSLDGEGGVDVVLGQGFTIGASGFGSTSKELGDYGAKVSASVRF